jgi:hypothetical protein
MPWQENDCFPVISEAADLLIRSLANPLKVLTQTKQEKC